MPTQLPRVPSLIPSSFATLAIGRDVSITIFTASSLNSGEKLFFGRGNYFTFPDIHPIGWTVRKPRGTSVHQALRFAASRGPPPVLPSRSRPAVGGPAITFRTSGGVTQRPHDAVTQASRGSLGLLAGAGVPDIGGHVTGRLQQRAQFPPVIRSPSSLTIDAARLANTRGAVVQPCSGEPRNSKIIDWSQSTRSSRPMCEVPGSTASCAAGSPAMSP